MNAKRLAALAGCSLLLLSGCGNGAAPDEGVAAHYSSMDGFNTHVKISSDLGKTTLDYELDYEYHKESSDVETITAPASIAGICVTIAGKDSAAFSLQYEDTVLDDGMPMRKGVTPADCVFCLLDQLRTARPLDYSKENLNGVDTLVLRYEELDGDRTITRRVWLREKDFALICAEVYEKEKRLLTIVFSDYQIKTEEATR